MNALKASAVRDRFRRQVTSVMLVLSLSVGAIVVTPTPAHAATSVFGCFRYSGLNAGIPPAGTPVYLTFWNGYAWQNTGYYLPMDRNGCVWMPTNLYANLWLRLYVNTGGALGTWTTGGTFSGFSPLMALPGSQPLADLGTGYLTYSCAGKVSGC